MDTTPRTPPKVKMTLHLSAEAVDVLRFAGYASDRTVGAFVSELILDYHRHRQKAPPSPAEVAQELRRLADRLEVSREPTGRG